jgi:hypothetical protein
MFNKIEDLFQAVHKLFKIFAIKENLVFFKNRIAIIFKTTLAFGNC